MEGIGSGFGSLEDAMASAPAHRRAGAGQARRRPTRRPGGRRGGSARKRRRQNVTLVVSVVVLVGLVGATLIERPGRASADKAWPPPGATHAALIEIPRPWLARYYDAARDCPGLPWAVLAAIGRVESRHGADRRRSPAGALGPMQFMPATWRVYGVDADGDGKADVYDPDDAVHGAAKYLCANGGGNSMTLRQSLWDYNHAGWYVDDVLAQARRYGPVPTATG